MRGNLWRGAAIFAGGTAIAQGITLLIGPVLTRLYTPGDFGIFAVFSALLAVGTTVATARYELAVLVAKDDRELASVALFAALFALSLTLLIGGLLTFSWTRSSVGAALLPVTNLGILLASLLAESWRAVLHQWALRMQRIRAVSLASVAFVLFACTVQVGLGIGTTGARGLLIGDVCGRVAALLLLAWSLRAALTRSVRLVSPKSVFEAARRYRSFPLLSVASSVLDSAASQTPTFLIARCFGAGSAGQFFLAWRIVAVPAGLLGTSLSQSFTSYASRSLAVSGDGLLPLFLSSLRVLLITAIGVALLLGILGPIGVTLIFGSLWRDAGALVRIMAIHLISLLVCGPFLNLLYILERQLLRLAWSIANATAISSVVWVSALYGNSIALTVWSYVVAYGIFAWVHTYLCYRRLRAHHSLVQRCLCRAAQGTSRP